MDFGGLLGEGSDGRPAGRRAVVREDGMGEDTKAGGGWRTGVDGGGGWLLEEWQGEGGGGGEGVGMCRMMEIMNSKALQLKPLTWSNEYCKAKTRSFASLSSQHIHG